MAGVAVGIGDSVSSFSFGDGVVMATETVEDEVEAVVEGMMEAEEDVEVEEMMEAGGMRWGRRLSPKAHISE